MLELKEIGLRVASLRDTCGITAAEMAEKLEISEDNYNAFEHGEYDFAISTLNNIALILGVGNDCLAEGTNVAKSESG